MGEMCRTDSYCVAPRDVEEWREEEEEVKRMEGLESRKTMQAQRDELRGWRRL